MACMRATAFCSITGHPARGDLCHPQGGEWDSPRSSRGTSSTSVSAISTPDRDWGYAPEYTEAMWRMLQQDTPGDYVIATGETHTVREFVERAFGLVGLDWQEHVQIDARYFRPTEVDALLGDASKAQEKLAWEPKVRFGQLIEIMLEAELLEAGLDPVRFIDGRVRERRGVAP